jgi:uncharacterized membrane protein
MNGSMTLALTYLSTLVVFLILDGIWLGFVAGGFYSAVLDGAMLDNVRIAPAIMFYLLYVAGIVVFVRPRGRGSLGASAVYGAFFGVCAYGTYDLTNDAVLRVWTWQLTVTDIAWGAVVTAVASAAGNWVNRRRS